MNLSGVSVVCNSHVYICFDNTTMHFKDVDNLDAFQVKNFYVQGTNIFIVVDRN